MKSIGKPTARLSGTDDGELLPDKMYWRYSRATGNDCGTASQFDKVFTLSPDEYDWTNSELDNQD